MLRAIISGLLVAGAGIDASWAQDDRIFCDVARAHVPAGSTSCTAYMDKSDARRLNVIVTDLQGTTNVMLLRTDLPGADSCRTAPGLCVSVATDTPIAFGDACAGSPVFFNCPGITLYWLQDSRNGLVARTPKAAALVAVAKELRAGDQEVLITGQTVAISSKGSGDDERMVRVSRAAHRSRSMAVPATSVTLANLRLVMSALDAAGFLLEELVIFGDNGAVVVERGGAEFFLEARCDVNCNPKSLLSTVEFEREYVRRFAIVEIEQTATPDFPALRRLLMSALVTPGFRDAERERQGVLQLPGLYLLK